MAGAVQAGRADLVAANDLQEGEEVGGADSPHRGGKGADQVGGDCTERGGRERSDAGVVSLGQANKF